MSVFYCPIDCWNNRRRPVGNLAVRTVFLMSGKLRGWLWIRCFHHLVRYRNKALRSVNGLSSQNELSGPPKQFKSLLLLTLRDKVMLAIRRHWVLLFYNLGLATEHEFMQSCTTSFWWMFFLLSWAYWGQSCWCPITWLLFLLLLLMCLCSSERMSFWKGARLGFILKWAPCVSPNIP